MRVRAAQQPAGQIFGKMTDQSGAVMPGVTVKLTSPTNERIHITAGFSAQCVSGRSFVTEDSAEANNVTDSLHTQGVLWGNRGGAARHRLFYLSAGFPAQLCPSASVSPRPIDERARNCLTRTNNRTA